MADADRTDEDGSLFQVSDRVLWSLIAEGDHAAFTELFERHATAVFNYGYRLTASRAAAEDLLSSTFLTAWRTRSTAAAHGSISVPGSPSRFGQ